MSCLCVCVIAVQNYQLQLLQVDIVKSTEKDTN